MFFFMLYPSILTRVSSVGCTINAFIMTEDGQVLHLLQSQPLRSRPSRSFLPFNGLHSSDTDGPPLRKRSDDRFR